jgi:3-deoxy-D-manno-octulosonate 8-phosphate phosphatase (KDO 8-P phosphatase)
MIDNDFLSSYQENGVQFPENVLKKLQDLELVVFDVDGVLTDGGLLYGEQGETLKRFNVKDGVALKLLPKWGVEVAIITAKDSAPLRKRMTDLSVKHFYPGCHNKKEAFLDLLKRLNITAGKAAYIGDDVIDLQVMPLVSLALCPNDAHVLVKRYCDMTLQCQAGEGVAREVCDLLLSSRMPLENAYEIAQKPAFESKSN